MKPPGAAFFSIVDTAISYFRSDIQEGVTTSGGVPLQVTWTGEAPDSIHQDLGHELHQTTEVGFTGSSRGLSVPGTEIERNLLSLVLRSLEPNIHIFAPNSCSRSCNVCSTSI